MQTYEKPVVEVVLAEDIVEEIGTASCQSCSGQHPI
jgi:hypothetical protein